MSHELPELKSDQKVFVDNETYYFNCLKEREYQLLAALGELAALRDFVSLAEHKLDQRLQGQYTNEQILGMLLKLARGLMLDHSIQPTARPQFTFIAPDGNPVTRDVEDAQRQYGVHLKRIAELEEEVKWLQGKLDDSILETLASENEVDDIKRKLQESRRQEMKRELSKVTECGNPAIQTIAKIMIEILEIKGII